jgi:hypothetical protein
VLKLAVSFRGLAPPLYYEGPRPNPEMSQDFALWKRQIRVALDRLCALDFPRGVPQAQATDAGFRAVMHGLYMESHFAEFMACQAWRQAGLPPATGEALHTLQRHLDAYDEPATDAAILADPAWWAVLGQAALVVDLLG